MSSIWSILASLIEEIVAMGAGMASMAMNYEPEIPKELRK